MSLRRVFGFAKGLGNQQRGSVMVMFAVSLFAIASAASFAIDLSQLYLARQKNQLVSDLAALAAVSTSAPISDGLPSSIAAATARAVAVANGHDVSQMMVTVETSPARADVQALKVGLAESVAMPVGLLTAGAPTTVNVASWAEPNATGSCFRSQTGPTNIYGAAIVNAPSCKVEARTYLYSCGTSATTLSSAAVGYSPASEAPYLCASAKIMPNASSFQYNATVTDTIAGSPAVSGMLAHLDAMAGGWPFGTSSPVRPQASAGANATYNGVTATIAPNTRFDQLTISNSTLTFAGSGAADPGCLSPTTVRATLTLSGTNRMTFRSGCYVFGAAFNVQAQGDTQFAIAPNAAVVFVFNGTMTTAAGARMAFGDATVYFNGGSISNKGTRLTFGNGPFYLWGGTIYNETSTAALTFGNGPFYFYGGSVANNGSMTLGNGPFWFQGGSLSLNSGSTTSFGVGNMEFYGGSVVAGGNSVTFGAGGSASAGSGAVSMYGGSFSLPARSLTAIGTSFGFKGGTLSLTGIGAINATAPTDPHPALGYRNLLFGIWGGAFSLYQSGAQLNTMSGLVYAPSTNASIYGAQTVTPPAGGCFGVVSGVLDIYQNARINGAPCAGLTGSGTGSGALVQ